MAKARSRVRLKRIQTLLRRQQHLLGKLAKALEKQPPTNTPEFGVWRDTVLDLVQLYQKSFAEANIEIAKELHPDMDARTEAGLRAILGKNEKICPGCLAEGKSLREAAFEPSSNRQMRCNRHRRERALAKTRNRVRAHREKKQALNAHQ